MDRVVDLIINDQRAVVFTGVGISTESGIPDFRSLDGIWDRFAPDDFTYQKFIGDPEARRRHWWMLQEGGFTTKTKLNLARYVSAELDRLGRLDRTTTQNVNSLHQKAGVSDGKVFGFHGNTLWVVCSSCG